MVTINAQRRVQIERRMALFVLLVALTGAIYCVQPECFPTARQRLLREILTAIEARRADAYELSLQYLNSSPTNPFAIALSADAAAATFQQDAAVELYRKLPADAGRWELLSELGLARRCEVVGLLTEEERHLRRVLELDPYQLEANSRLGHILQIAGRSWEGISTFFKQIRLGKCRGDELLGFAAPERFFRSDGHLEQMATDQLPPDVLAKLALARRDLYDNKLAEAEALLREIIAVAPQLGEAQGRLGRIIFERGRFDEFLQWRARLPSDVNQHPEVWFVQGMQARRLGQLEGAVRCFLETLQTSPNHLAATLQIAGCLDQLKRHELAQEFVRRSEALGKQETQLNQLRNEINLEMMARVIATHVELGRFWEAAGWCHVMAQIPGVPPQPVRHDLRRWLQKATQDSGQVAAGLNPATKLRRTDFPEPNWPASVEFQSRAPELKTEDQTQWSFEDDAAKVGIDFQYFEGTTEENRLRHIFNVVGGGMAATDYDLDGWCDLYLAQANNWRDPSLQPDYPDRLFRNHETRFQDVTSFAGLGDLGFTHGVCAGDFDQDGFADLYLCNLGPNRLYHNNGDGTFTDVTSLADVAGNEWSTSSVLADFNGDGLPDLYVANYSVLEETIKKECKHSTGVPMACTPDLLTAEFHRLYLNLGDGSFRDVTTEAGMRVPNGRGLGIVAWDFAGDGRLSLFVGNDTSANFLFMNMGNRSDGVPEFREEAAIRGVAFDADGAAQACMGVAAGDINDDGLIDMYITNFFGESDTLYMQRSDGLFDDASRPYDLRDAGFWTLGFGCQFADFDGDGWEDIISTNGHVDQKSSRGDPDRAPPQLFRNRQGRRFEEVARARLGPFFQKNYLGRGLAKLDWNRDGRTDFAVSHLHGSFALVTNGTSTKDRPLFIRLVGRSGTLVPIGAVVQVRGIHREMHRLQTAGDGYLVTNDRYLHFAIPETQSAVEIEVRWPRGRVQRWSGVQPNSEILLREGEAHAVQLRSFPESKRSESP